jgi:hypothetical protein
LRKQRAEELGYTFITVWETDFIKNPNKIKKLFKEL